MGFRSNHLEVGQDVKLFNDAKVVRDVEVVHDFEVAHDVKVVPIGFSIQGSCIVTNGQAKYQVHLDFFKRGN